MVTRTRSTSGPLAVVLGGTSLSARSSMVIGRRGRGSYGSSFFLQPASVAEEQRSTAASVSQASMLGRGRENATRQRTMTMTFYYGFARVIV